MMYVVMAALNGIEDVTYEEYTGERYATREEAQPELLQAIQDINTDGAYIKEVSR